MLLKSFLSPTIYKYTLHFMILHHCGDGCFQLNSEIGVLGSSMVIDFSQERDKETTAHSDHRQVFVQCRHSARVK